MDERRGGRVGRWAGRAVVVTLLLAGCDAPGTPEARDRLEQALSAMGTPEALREAGPLVVQATGTLDKAAEGQAHRPGRPSPGPYRETWALDVAAGLLLWSYEETRYDGSSEAYGELFRGDTLQVLLLRDLGLAVPRTGRFAGDRRRLARRLPHLLVAELLEESGAALTDGPSRPDEPIAGRLADGTDLAILLDPASGVVREVVYDAVLPGRGPTRIRWRWSDWRDVAPGVLLPFAWTSSVGERAYTEMSVDRAEVGGEGSRQALDGLRVLEARPVADRASPPPELERERLHPGVYRVPNVRSGFAPLVVELPEGLAVVDAPASFPLLGTIPPGETDPGPSMSAPARRLLGAVDRWWPGTPVRYLVLTHHHEDHVGGVRPFVAAGATVLGSPEALEVARGLALLPGDVVGDDLGLRPGDFRSQTVTEPRTLGSGPGRMRLVPVGDNPHAAGILVVSLPDAGALYVSDLITPGPLEDYPGPAHAPLDRHFAAWLEEAGLDPDTIWSMHTDEPLTRSHLERLSGSAPP